MRRTAALVAAALSLGMAACGDDAHAAGELLDDEPVATGAAGEADTFRIRYASVDVGGDASEVTGLVAVPRGDPPEGGWPVVAWAHATTGVNDRCAPSRDPSLAGVGRLLGRLAEAGYVAVATDYEGLGTPGGHPYLHGPSAARAVVDSVRAAREMVPDTSRRWAVAGHSQGGHAALFTAELAEELVPELELVGAVALAPVGDLADLFEPGSDPRRLLVPLLAEGILTADPDVEADDLLTPLGVEAVEAVRTACLAEASTQPVLRDGVEAVDDYLAHNSPGRAPAVAPVLVLQGIRDELTTPDATRAVVDRLCARGDTVALEELPSADHATVVPQGLGRALAWLADRFAGRAAPGTCAAGP